MRRAPGLDPILSPIAAASLANLSPERRGEACVKRVRRSGKRQRAGETMKHRLEASTFRAMVGTERNNGGERT